MSENNKLQQKIDHLVKSEEEKERQIERLICEKENLQKSSSSFEKEVDELKKMIMAIRQNSRQSIIKLEEKTTKESETIRQLKETLADKEEQLQTIRLQLQETRSGETSKLVERIGNLECEKLRLSDRLSQSNHQKSALLLENEKLKQASVDVPLHGEGQARQSVTLVYSYWSLSLSGRLRKSYSCSQRTIENFARLFSSLSR